MMTESDLTRQIIGCAQTVLYTLRPGLDEKMYERALIIELSHRGLRAEAQKQFPVLYRNEQIGVLIPDLVVEGRVIVDTKVVTEFQNVHLAQVLGYLKITGLQIGLLLNFKSTKLSIKRLTAAEVRP